MEDNKVDNYNSSFTYWALGFRRVLETGFWVGSIKRIEVSTRSMETSTQSQFEANWGKLRYTSTSCNNG